jgi:A/G-specific adenine glycosylase
MNLHRSARIVAERGWPGDLTSLPGVGRYTADAVSCFAFGRAVLPVDTNVRRVLERTGLSLGAGCAHALMDLGATVCLARVPRCGICPLAAACPARGSRFEPRRKQSPFEGSFRQRRSAALRCLSESPQRVDELDVEALEALVRDGLAEIEAGIARLPR